MNLHDDDHLTAAANEAFENQKHDPSYKAWTRQLAAHLDTVHQADQQQFRQEEFQKSLWESEAISDTGQGKIATHNLWTDVDIVDCLWQVKSIDQFQDPISRTQELQRLWEEIITLIARHNTRMPRLKLARVFAALQPQHFTTLADAKVLDTLGKSMGAGRLRDGRAVLNQRILDRLDAVWLRIRIPPDEQPELARMTLPWLLFKKEAARAVEEQILEPAKGAHLGELRPIPPNRRRRGMLAIGGSLPSVLAMLQFVKDGCSREDFREHVRAVNPKLSAGSINTNINALIAEWGVLAAEGTSLRLTSRGEAFLESGEPDEVSDWLLTQILGFDNLLCVLREGPQEQRKLISALQQVNPGWKTNFAPTAMIGWFRAMGLMDFVKGEGFSLTSRGLEWANRIHWEPGVLPVPPTLGEGSTEPLETIVNLLKDRPSVPTMLSLFPHSLVFKPSLIAHLDAALWSHERRHFAVLTGLSGSGKTQLARSYGRALRGQTHEGVGDGVYILPVQPGWHDPSPLLGYINPLNTERYVRTGFLTFLLDAVRDPERPYTVVLDEMNLSHPEQYLAPLLSAMETGDQIELHSQDDVVDEIPASVPYPSNLVIIGTVNMDETTHGLSDKVLDRAAVIEFWDIETNDFPGWGNSALATEQTAQLRGLLAQLNAALRPTRLHFGWRVIGDVIGYVRAALAGGVTSFHDAVDQAILGKVLPKMRGEDSPRLRGVFAKVHLLLTQEELTASSNKVAELSEDLVRLGSARFWR